MLQGPVRLSILSGALAFGAIGAALMLAGAGVPFLLAGGLASAAAALVQYAAARNPPAPDRSAEAAALSQLEAYRGHTAALRHDLRGVLSPALMISDRLLRHADPAVQRAGQTVVRSVDRATALLSAHKDTLTEAPPADAGPG